LVLTLIVAPHIGPSQVRKRLRERGEASLIHGIVVIARNEHADAPHAPVLLRPPRAATPLCRRGK
jgi:hypothetical protein